MTELCHPVQADGQMSPSLLSVRGYQARFFGYTVSRPHTFGAGQDLYAVSRCYLLVNYATIKQLPICRYRLYNEPPKSGRLQGEP